MRIKIVNSSIKVADLLQFVKELLYIALDCPRHRLDLSKFYVCFLLKIDKILFQWTCELIGIVKITIESC